MKSKWKVSSNYVCGDKLYAAYRLLDVGSTDHSGNREYSPMGYVMDRATAQAEADRLNEQQTDDD